MQAALPAPEKVLAGHAAHAALLVAVQAWAAKAPAAHDAQAVQGSKPVEDHETPAAHGVLAHARRVAFQK